MRIDECQTKVTLRKSPSQYSCTRRKPRHEIHNFSIHIAVIAKKQLDDAVTTNNKQNHSLRGMQMYLQRKEQTVLLLGPADRETGVCLGCPSVSQWGLIRKTSSVGRSTLHFQLVASSTKLATEITHGMSTNDVSVRGHLVVPSVKCALTKPPLASCGYSYHVH